MIEKHHLHILEILPQPVLIYKSGKIIYSNQAAWEKTGYNKEELLNMDYVDLIHPKYRILAVQFKNDTLSGKCEPIIHQFKIIQKSGTERWMETHERLFSYEGEPAVMVSATDITDLKREKELICAKDDDFFKAFHLAPLMMSISNISDGKYIAINNKALEILEFTRDEMIGKTSIELGLFHLEDRKKLINLIVSQDRVDGIELTLSSKSGKNIHCLYNGEIITVDGEKKLLSILLDITERKKAEALLRESEENYRMLAENASDIIWTVNLQMKLTYISPSVTRILGFSKEEALNRSMQEAYSPDSYELAQSLISEVMTREAKGENPPDLSMNIELKLWHKLGYIVPLEVSFNFVRNADGSPACILAIARDITERKKLEERIHESEERYRLIAENADDVIWLWDLKANRYSYVSPSVIKLRKFTPEEIMQQTLMDALLPESEWLLTQELPRRLQALESGDETSRVKSYELLQRCKDGSLIFTEVVTTFVTDKLGHITYIQGITRNITERRKMEERIRESEERYRSLFQNNHANLLVIDPENGQIIDANPAACKYYGYDLDDLKKKNLIEINTLTSEQLFEEMARAKAEQRNRFYFYHRLANGEIRPVEVYAGPIEIHGKQLLYSIIHDISERKMAEEAARRYRADLERSNRDLQEFAYIASHDLKAPLRAIQSFGELLKMDFEELLTGEAIDYINRIQHAAVNMNSLIESLMEYSKVATIAKPFALVDLNEVIEDVASDFLISVRKSDGKLEIGKLPKIEADRMQIHQLMQNLIANALKFQPPGAAPIVKIYSQCFSEHSAKKFCQIYVQDNGIGFDENSLDHIFQPFKRLHSQKEYPGSGIGLAICKKIVNRHNGNITAKSIRGHGSTFIVTLPITQEKLHTQEKN